MRFAGIGFRGAATLASLRSALVRANPEGSKIDALVTEAAKARAPVFRAFAQELGVPGLGITTEDLAAMITPTQSARITDKFGTGSLSEAAALAAGGPGAVLIAVRAVSDDAMATAAIAETKGNTP
jgi:cobalt-precorrin 5A hydrolase